MSSFQFSDAIRQKMMDAACEKRTFEQFADTSLSPLAMKELESIRQHPKAQTEQTLALLSDQCEHTIQILWFADTEKTELIETTVLHGSLVKQLKDAIAALEEKQIDENAPVVPLEALVEALTNAVCHRDYTYSGSTYLYMGPNDAEVVSLGGLTEGLLPEDLSNGVCESRNKELCSVISTAGFAKGYGSGIRTILTMYRGAPVQPKFQITKNSFKLTLPSFIPAESKKTKEDPYNRVIKKEPTEQMSKILEFIDQYGFITDEVVEDLLKVKKTRAYLILQDMLKDHMIAQIGRGKTKRYEKI